MPNITVYITKQVADALKKVKINKSKVTNDAFKVAIRKMQAPDRVHPGGDNRQINREGA